MRVLFAIPLLTLNVLRQKNFIRSSAETAEQRWTAKGERKMRDRLIELLEKADETVIGFSIEGDIGVLADHLLAEGVIVPPCKVGDEVYITLNPYTFLPLKKVVKGEIVSIHIHEWGIFVRVLFDTKNINGCRDYEERTWGKTLFFAREEAEKSLKGRTQ